MVDIDTFILNEMSKLKHLSFEQLLEMPEHSSWNVINGSEKYNVEMQINKQLKDTVRVMLEISHRKFLFFFSGKTIYWGKNSMNELIESDDMVF